MEHTNEMVASQSSKGSVWLPVIIGSVLSGAVSATVGYIIGARPKACSCKKIPKPAGEKA